MPEPAYDSQEKVLKIHSCKIECKTTTFKGINVKGSLFPRVVLH